MTTEKELSFWNKYGVYIIGGSGLMFIGIGASIAYAGRKARQAAMQDVPQQVPQQQPVPQQPPVQQQPVPQQPPVQQQPVPQQPPVQQQPVPQQPPVQQPRLLTQQQIQDLSQQQAQVLYSELRENPQYEDQYRNRVINHWNHLIQERLIPTYGGLWGVASLIEKEKADVIKGKTECILEEAKREATRNSQNQNINQHWSNLRNNAMLSLGSVAQDRQDSEQRLTWTFYEAEEILRAGGELRSAEIARVLKDYSAIIWNYYMQHPAEATAAYNIVIGEVEGQTCQAQGSNQPSQQ